MPRPRAVDGLKMGRDASAGVLVAQALGVDLEVDVVVAVLGADVLDEHRAEVGAQVLADDAEIVLLAALAGRSIPFSDAPRLQSMSIER
jgi:hypothetical protein